MSTATNIPHAVRELIEEYRRFLRTSYRFLDGRLREQFEAHLAAANLVVRGPYVTLARDFATGATLRELVVRGDLAPELARARWAFGDGPLFRHQEEALLAGRAGRSFVVTSGTGSGKTEAFLLPVLDGILRRKAEGVTGVQAVFVYPQNALANDQLERLRRLLRGSGLALSFGLYTGDSDAAVQNLREEPAETERLRRSDIRHDPPDILITNYKQLEFLLVRREDRGLFTPSLRFLVLDELHSYRGALATEIACLIRRLKAHAGLAPGRLVVIGTSATVAAAGGAEALAAFLSTLAGEEVRPEDIIGEAYAPREDPAAPYLPPLPDLTDAELAAFAPDDDGAVAAFAERLTGRRCPPAGPIADRVRAALAGNRVVAAMEEIFARPVALDEAAEALARAVPERAGAPADALRREVEAYLLVGSVGDEEHPPRLRPKLHTFFHGIYDVSLCLDPDCRTLVPRGASHCTRCGAIAWPAALCRTCGQDFVKVEVTAPGQPAVGSGDFFSDEHTCFLTHELRQLPGVAEPEEDGENGEAGEDGAAEAGGSPAAGAVPAARRLTEVGVCRRCGRIYTAEAARCDACDEPLVRMLQHAGRLSTCPVCGDTYTRGDIVTPLRTGTASTVSVLASHHLDRLRGEDRKLLIFADNRQDAAHQAGYTAHKHRTFAFRHIIVDELRRAVSDGLGLTSLPQRILDRYRETGITLRTLTRDEQALWLQAITYELASEVTRYSQQRAALETLGLVAVEYEFLDRLLGDSRFLAAAAAAGLEPDVALNLVRAVLDLMRLNRAVAYDGRPETRCKLPFFAEYIDPVRKRAYRELEDQPYGVRFPDRGRNPRAYALDRPADARRGGRLAGIVRENPRGRPPGPHALAARLCGGLEPGETFLRAVIPLLAELGILVEPQGFSIPAAQRTHALRPLQVDPRVIRLAAAERGFRCNACQSWRPYRLPTCPIPTCRDGRLQPDVLDRDDYYVRLYTERSPQRLAVAEHSAQIAGDERAKRETDFKEGRLNVLVCTPTLELGVDIGPLLTVVLRNAPPTPANYAQRVGRAGRRLRIGFVSTFCAAGAHDRHAFEHPEWFVAGEFAPPLLRLENDRIVYRHLRSYLLACLEAKLPDRLGEFLDDLEQPTGWNRGLLDEVLGEVRARRNDLVRRLTGVMAADRAAGRTGRYGDEDAARVVDRFEEELVAVLERWWDRVQQVYREWDQFRTIVAKPDFKKKAAARERAYRELTQDPEQAYTLNYLATEGLLPSYQFPVDTFSLDPGVNDTPTLRRSAATALEEFAPGNFVYANGHKLRSIRVILAGGPGTARPGPGRSEAETSGRLEPFHFCETCDQAVELGANQCPRCGGGLGEATDVIFADAFEAEESTSITADEEARQRRAFVVKEALLPRGEAGRLVYPYDIAPLTLLSSAEVLLTNWGAQPRNNVAAGFWLCPDCGRHQPYATTDPDHQGEIQRWQVNHQRVCPQGEAQLLILGYRFRTDVLILPIPHDHTAVDGSAGARTPLTVTLAQALTLGASQVLQVEGDEIRAFVRRGTYGERSREIVFYETVPGGAGYLEELARRLPEVAERAYDLLFQGHACTDACYQCLKHYGNQRLHALLRKGAVADILLNFAALEPVAPQPAPAAEAAQDAAAAPLPTRVYPKGEIEEILLNAMEQQGIEGWLRDYEVRAEDGQVVTVPDFAWPELKLAVFCDGYSYHGNPKTLAEDARKRNYLAIQGWATLVFWGRSIKGDAARCARQVAEALAARRQLRLG